MIKWLKYPASASQSGSSKNSNSQIKDAEKETWPKQFQHHFVFYTNNADSEKC